MNTVVIGAPTSSTVLSTITSCAAVSIARIRRHCDFAEATYAAAVRHLHRAVSRRKEALTHRMQEFVLEVLAAIVLLAIFMVATDPAMRDC